MEVVRRALDASSEAWKTQHLSLLRRWQHAAEAYGKSRLQQPRPQYRYHYGSENKQTWWLALEAKMSIFSYTFLGPYIFFLEQV